MLDYNPRRLRPGELAYDIMQTTPVVVTDVTTPRVRNLDDATQEQVLDAHGNQLLDVNGDSATAEIAFPGLKKPASKGYTFPTERLLVPDVTSVTDGLTAAQLAQVQLLDDLAAEAARADDTSITVELFYRMARSAGVDAEVIDHVFGTQVGGDGE